VRFKSPRCAHAGPSTNKIPAGSALWQEASSPTLWPTEDRIGFVVVQERQPPPIPPFAPSSSLNAAPKTSFGDRTPLVGAPPRIVPGRSFERGRNQTSSFAVVGHMAHGSPWSCFRGIGPRGGELRKGEGGPSPSRGSLRLARRLNAPIIFHFVSSSQIKKPLRRFSQTALSLLPRPVARVAVHTSRFHGRRSPGRKNGNHGSKMRLRFQFLSSPPSAHGLAIFHLFRARSDKISD